MRIFVAALVATATLASLPGEAREESPFTVLETAVVQIGELGPPHKFSGTGFFLDEFCTVATAKHILKNIKEGKLAIRFSSREQSGRSWTSAAVVLDQDQNGDLAFLRPAEAELRCPSSKYHHFPIYRHDQTPDLAGEEIFIFGHPTLVTGQHFDKVIVRKGVLASTEIKWEISEIIPMLLLDLHGVPGFSGSPVVLARTGEVLGVVFGPGPTSRIAGFEWATPLTWSRYQRALEP